MKNFLNKLSYIVFVLILILVTVLFLAPSLPIKDIFSAKIVKSGSMEPAINTGGIVFIIPSSEYKVGDVITFGKDTKTSFPTTHRIVEIKKVDGQTFYQVKGDANEEADPSLTDKRDVIGKVVFDVPYVGYVIDFARQPVGFSLLIALPAALIILNELIDIFKEIGRLLRRKKKEDEPEIQDESRRVLKRVHKIDDVLRPIYIPYKTAMKARKKSRVPAVASIAMFLALGLTFTRSGETKSYFSDNELSTGNTLSAINFEINASTASPESYVGHTGSANLLSTVTPNPVGLPNEYELSVEKLAGSDAFCQALIVTSTSTPPFLYNGPLLNFVSPHTTYSGDWSFEVSLDPNYVEMPGDECAINLVYSAATWLPDKGIHAGYSDVARVSVIIEGKEEVIENFSVQRFALPSDLVVTEDATSSATTTDATVEEPEVEEDLTSTSTEPLITEPEKVEEPEEIVEEENVVEEEIKDELVSPPEEVVEPIIENPVVVE